jgi:hypothetical protein
MGNNLKDLDAQMYGLERTVYYQAYLTQVLKAVF